MITTVKMPILLGRDLSESQILYPDKGSLTINMVGASEATLTFPANGGASIPMHAWVKIYNQNGAVGIYRRTSANRNVPTNNTVTLRHGIDIMQDSIWQDADPEDGWSGTMTQYLTAILDKQVHKINGVKPWVLGTCEDTSSVSEKKNQYENLLDLLEALEDETGNFYFTYDQTSFPWVLNWVRKSSTVASEFRLSRNVESVKISENDSELCTRLILNVNAMMPISADKPDVKENKSVIRVYNNTDAQAIYGIVCKTADIDTKDTVPGGPFPKADRWAAKFLAARAAPITQIQIDGQELYKLTGDTWDETTIGTQCRVALPDYSVAMAERVVSVSYPDLYGQPDRVSVSLANTLPKVSNSIKTVNKEISRAGGGARGAAREAESFQQHFKIVDESGSILRQAGMYLDANGLLVYANDNVNMIGSKFQVQADRIGMIIGTNDHGNYIKAGEIALAINATTGESTAIIDANHVNISATNTLYTLAGTLHVDAQGRLIIDNAGGVYVERTESGITSRFGIWDKGNLTGGVIVQQINGQTGTKITIKADVIDIQGLIASLEAYDVMVANFNANNGEFTGDLSVLGSTTVNAIEALSLSTGSVSASGNVSAASVIASGAVTGGSLVISNRATVRLLTVGDYNATWHNQSVITGVTPVKTTSKQWQLANGDTWTGQVMTSVNNTTNTIYYLGRDAT